MAFNITFISDLGRPRGITHLNMLLFLFSSAMGGFFEVLEQCLLATSEPQENIHTTTAHNPQVCAGVNFRGRGNQQGEAYRGLPAC